MNKDVRQFIRRAKADGWTAERTRKGHIKLTYPGAADVICSSTPGDRRALLNTKQDMRRAKRRVGR